MLERSIELGFSGLSNELYGCGMEFVAQKVRESGQEEMVVMVHPFYEFYTDFDKPEEYIDQDKFVLSWIPETYADLGQYAKKVGHFFRATRQKMLFLLEEENRLAQTERTIRTLGYDGEIWWNKTAPNSSLADY